MVYFQERHRQKKKPKLHGDKEKLSLYYVQAESENKYGNISNDDFMEYLEEQNIPTSSENGKNYAEVNGRIYDIGIDKDGNITIEYVNQGKIDGPRINKIEITSKTQNSISIKVTSSRMDGGKYKYYISTDESNYGTEKGSNQTGEYTFVGLSENNKYYIKVVGETSQGNCEKTIAEEIKAIPEATSSNIKYTIKWANGVATVTVSTTQTRF